MPRNRAPPEIDVFEDPPTTQEMIWHSIHSPPRINEGSMYGNPLDQESIDKIYRAPPGMPGPPLETPEEATLRFEEGLKKAVRDEDTMRVLLNAIQSTPYHWNAVYKAFHDINTLFFRARLMNRVQLRWAPEVQGDRNSPWGIFDLSPDADHPQVYIQMSARVMFASRERMWASLLDGFIMAYLKICTRQNLQADSHRTKCVELLRPFTIYHLGVDIGFKNRLVWSENFPTNRQTIPGHPSITGSENQTYRIPVQDDGHPVAGHWRDG